MWWAAWKAPVITRREISGPDSGWNRPALCLEEVGLEGDRVRMYNLSSGEGPTFAAYAKEMTEHIKVLGPNPLKKWDETSCKSLT